LVTGLLWCNILTAKILNIENKISLDFPANHKYTELKEDDVFFGEYMHSTFEDLEMFDPKVFISGPNNLIDFIEAVRNGEDPMENKYISSFMKKVEKKSETMEGFNYGKWLSSEIKKTLKKAKIDFNSYILISEKKIDNIDTSDLGFDLTEFQEMNNAELKQVTKEIRTMITEEVGDNKTIGLGAMKLVIKKFKITKNEYNNLFIIGEAKFYMAVNEILSMDGNFVLFATVKNDRAYAILSECWVNCSGHGKKVDKMIKPMFSTNTSIGSSSTTKNTSSNESDLVEQLNSLNELYKSGILTQEEFEKAKKRILN
jgi:hypothetical protein